MYDGGVKPSPGELVRAARIRHGLDQRELARRCGTSQAQISRIEQGSTSPSVATLQRLMAAMGERLELASSVPRGSRSIGELRADAALTPAERVAQAARLSRTLTAIASAAAGQS